VSNKVLLVNKESMELLYDRVENPEGQSLNSSV